MSELDDLKAQRAAAVEDRAKLAAMPAEPGNPDIAELDRSIAAKLDREIQELDHKIQVAEAKEGIELASMLGGEPKPPPTPTGASIAPDIAKAAPRGCSPTLFVIAAIVVALVIGGIAILSGKDEGEVAAECKASAPITDDDPPLQLISFAQECPDDEEETTTTGATGADDASKPSADEIPDGAILISGSSGGPIGCITCDGQSRFLSLEDDVTAIGNGNAQSVSTVWDQNGQILSFGARLSAPNQGRYGINFFYTDSFEYGPGVALEIGEQSAEYQWTPERDGTVQAGRPVAIIVGEGGTVDDEGVPIPTGEYELEWWFVFQPG